MSKVFKYQGYHLLAFIAMGAFLWYVVGRFPEAQGRSWGLPASWWVLISWLCAAAFQASVMLFWRLELNGGRVSALLGRRAFLCHRIAFVTLATARFLPLVPVSIATTGTSPLPPALAFALIVVTTPPILWGLYSVVFYFGVNRAFGADHFDPVYRTMGLEKRGIFRYVPNAMYTVVLLLLYHPALLWQSRLGLVVTAAHHLLVWVHYFCTEKPDMREIYGNR